MRFQRNKQPLRSKVFKTCFYVTCLVYLTVGFSGVVGIYNKNKAMNIDLIEDIEIAILSIKDGNIEEAIKMLEEIQEKHGFDINPKIFPN